MKNKIECLTHANQSRIEKNYEEAIQAYLSVLEVENDSDVMRALAITYFEQYLQRMATVGPGEQALYWINKAISLEPNRAEFYVTRAGFFSIGIDAPNYEQAAQDYHFALQLNPHLLDAYCGLAGLEGVPEGVITLSETISVTEFAVTIQPNDPQTLVWLARLYQKAGREADSLAVFQRALLCPKPLPLENVNALGHNSISLST
jgi:tetratricopeptide (TPR) repeat protein